MDILLLSASGSGKGTQADILAAKLGRPHIASGDLLRAVIERQTAMGQQAKPYYDRGDLVPDSIMVEMFLQRLAEPDSVKGAILDGFPRTIAQARVLDEALVPLHRAIDLVIYLKADQDVLVRRLANRYICRAQQHPYNLITNPPKQPGICDIDGSPLYQRSDDTEEAVRRRLEIFFSETIKLLDYYGAKGKVKEIDAEQPISAVHAAILRALGLADVSPRKPASQTDAPLKAPVQHSPSPSNTQQPFRDVPSAQRQHVTGQREANGLPAQPSAPIAAASPEKEPVAADRTHPAEPIHVNELGNTPESSNTITADPTVELEEQALFLRFTPSSLQAFKEAEEIRAASGKQEIHMEHLLVGLLAKKGGPTEEVLAKANIDATTLGEVIQFSFPPARIYNPSKLTSLPPVSAHVRSALVAARDIAGLHESDLIRSRHLLYGALSVTTCHVIQALLARGVKKEDINLSPKPPLDGSSLPQKPGSSPPPLAIAGFATDAPNGQDLLGIQKEVEALCSVLAAKDVEPPLSLGLFADWGSGKSFFMRMMQERIEELKEAAQQAKGETAYCKHIIQLEFNAWHYIDTNLWASLTSEIFEGLASALVSKDENNSEYKRAQLLASTIKSKEEFAKAEQEKSEAEAKLVESQQRLQHLEYHEATIEASLTPQAIIQGALRVTLRQPEAQEAIEEAKELSAKMGRAAKELNYPTPDIMNAELKTELLELRGIWGTMQALARAIRNAGIYKAWLSVILGITVLVLTLVGGFVLLIVFRTYLVGVLGSGLGLLLSIIACLSPFIPGVRRAVSIIKQAQEEYAHLVEQERQRRQKELLPKHEKLEQEVKDAQQRLEKAWLHLENAAHEVKANEQEMEALRADRQMTKFIQQRQASRIYTKHLGVIAQAREDFAKLSMLLAKEREEAKKETSTSQEEPLLPRIDRIILYIDDLDRCPEQQVVDVLQAVHLLLAFPLFIVVVGVDARWLLHSLKQHSMSFQSEADKRAGISAEEYAPWKTTPLNYLEKIFQIPFTLRPMDAAGFERLVDALTSQQKRKHLDRGSEQITGGLRIDGGGDTGHQDDMAALRGNTPASGEQSPGLLPSLSETAPEVLAPSVSPPPLPPQEDIDLNPEFLQIEDWERTVMKKLYHFMPSPRATKRFINIYLLLRASIEEKRLQTFIGDINGGQHRTMLLLLAMLIGYADETTEILLLLLEQKHSETWWNFIDALQAGHTSPTSAITSTPQYHESGVEVERWQQLLEKLTRVRSLIPEDQLCSDFVECAPLVARYSYQSRPILFTSGASSDASEQGPE